MNDPNEDTGNPALGEPFIDINYVAQKLHIPVDKMEAWAAKSLMPHYMFPERTIMFRKPELLQWLATRSRNGQQNPAYDYGPRQAATEGARLRTIRVMNGLSKEAMAKELNGIRSSTTIYHYEAGWGAIPDNVTTAVSQRFGINQSWLKTGERPMGQKGIAHFTIATRPIETKHIVALTDNVRHMLSIMMGQASAFTLADDPINHPEMAENADHQSGPVQIFVIRFDYDDYAVIRTNAPTVTEAIKETIEAKTNIRPILRSDKENIPQALRYKDNTQPGQIESFLQSCGLINDLLEPF